MSESALILADLFAFRPHFVERALSSHPGGASPYRTVANSSPGQSICPSAIGFMSTSLLGLKLIMTSLFSTEPWLRDLSVVPMPWRAEKESIRGKLCFAVLRNDRMVQPHPPIARGIEIVADAVQNSGHTVRILVLCITKDSNIEQVIEWEPSSHEAALALHVEQLHFLADDDG
ncbi:Acetamidase [Metarhizium acridum]|nr:Acetamidase [Metarhizium acridum]